MGESKRGAKVTKSGFKGALAQMVPARKLEAICARHAPVARTAPQLSATQLVESLVYHQLQPAGSLGQHAAELHGVKLSESAHAQRRQGLPFALFDEVLTAALRPLADAERQPECFFHGWRVVGIDGTEWSVTNTPAILAQLPKAATRRFRAAFAKLRLVTAVELGVHHPLAAAVGPMARGEQALAAQLWAKLPDHSLVILDRLFGSPATLWQALAAWEKRPMAFLARVKANIKAEVSERLADGSALVAVPVYLARRKVGTLQVREVRAEGTTVDGRKFALRFWTNLLDPATYPAETLARHYVERWEQELYYRELKLDVRGSDVLASHTVETALQELAALVLATAVVAQVRVAAAEGLGVPPRRISFLKVLLATRQLWQSFAWAGGSLTPAQRRRILACYRQRLHDTALLPERRARSCPRVLRQPSSSWPRKLFQPSFLGRSSLLILPLP